MWILLMVVFSQPYEVDRIELLGDYKHKQECVVAQDRALRIMNASDSGVVSFGCLKIGFLKTSGDGMSLDPVIQLSFFPSFAFVGS